MTRHKLSRAAATTHASAAFIIVLLSILPSTVATACRTPALAVAKGWGVGSKETGDGLLLLLAVKDRGWRVQVSRSLEATLPDEAVAEICRSAAPFYREGRYGEGVSKCVDGLVARLVEKKGFKLDE